MSLGLIHPFLCNSCPFSRFELATYEAELKLPNTRNRFKFKRTQRTPPRYTRIRPRPGAIQIGPINTAHAPVVAERHTPTNELKGILKRLAHEQKPITRSALRKLARTTDTFLAMLEPLPALDPVEALEDWLTNSTYGLKRQEQLRQMFHKFWSLPIQKRHLECKGFIKEEFYTEEKFARCIISRDDVFKSLVGGIMHALDEYCYKNSPISKHFVKHKPVDSYPSMMAEVARIYRTVLETDYSSFEGSFQLKYQQVVEIRFFKHMLKNNPIHLSYVLASYPPTAPSGMNKADKDRYETTHSPWIQFPFYKIKLPDNRKSGEMWTSLANGFSNLVNMKCICDKHGQPFDGFVEGDDGYFGLADESITSQDFDELGFTIKMQYATEPSDLSFCGVRFSMETNHALLTEEYLTRIGWTCKEKYFNASDRTKLALFKSYCMSIMHLSRHTPILGPLVAHYLSLLKDIVAKHDALDWWEKHMLAEYKDTSTDIHPHDRSTYAKITSIPSLKQQQIEELIPTLTLDDNFIIDLPNMHQNLTRLDPAGGKRWSNPSSKII